MITKGFSEASGYMYDRKILTWSVPSGHTCIGADKCFASADRATGVLTNGENQEYRCYSAVTERFPAVRAKYWANYEAVKGKPAQQVAEELECLPAKARVVRVHVAGDFFHQDYFDGWLQFASRRNHVSFYAFTKSLPLWIRRIKVIPDNFKLIASHGGKFDQLIEEHGLRSAKVVESATEAQAQGLEVDYDDRVAAEGQDSFALIAAPNGVRPQTLTVRGEQQSTKN